MVFKEVIDLGQKINGCYDLFIFLQLSNQRHNQSLVVVLSDGAGYIADMAIIMFVVLSNGRRDGTGYIGSSDLGWIGGMQDCRL